MNIHKTDPYYRVGFAISIESYSIFKVLFIYRVNMHICEGGISIDYYDL